MRIPLAREGYPFVLSTALPAIVLLDAALLIGGVLLWTVAILITVFAICVIGFFRDPERDGPSGSHLVLAPADGKVIEISTVDEPSYLHGRALKISVFLSLLDVHVNRYPVSGAVELRQYDQGRFEPAWRRSASTSNERSSTGIDALGVPVLIRQVAGLAAKRIVTYAKVGDQVQQGERMGLIRFGSRVDVYLPVTAAADVRVGERAVGGVTILARLAAGTE